MYIEYIFLENFIINFFIISITGKFLKEKNKLFYLSAFLGALIAVVCPLFNLGLATSIVIKVFTSIMICCLSFKMKNLKQILFSFLLFFMTTFIFGGGVEFLKQIIGYVNLLIVLLTALCVYIMQRIIVRYLNKKKIIDNFTVKVQILDGEKKIEETGYFDTGNLLYDPITSKPICLITHQVFSKLYEKDIISIFVKKIDEKTLKNGHYITVNSAVKGGKILVFCVDEMILDDGKEKKQIKDACLGLSFSGFEKAMHSQILLHSSQI